MLRGSIWQIRVQPGKARGRVLAHSGVELIDSGVYGDNTAAAMPAAEARPRPSPGLRARAEPVCRGFEEPGEVSI